MIWDFNMTMPCPPQFPDCNNPNATMPCPPNFPDCNNPNATMTEPDGKGADSSDENSTYANTTRTANATDSDSRDSFFSAGSRFGVSVASIVAVVVVGVSMF